MTTATYSAAYLAEAIADEAAIARLLGYIRMEVPNAPVPASVIWGVRKDFVPDWEGATGREMLPRWRRDWAGAGELISSCDISVNTNIGESGLVDASFLTECEGFADCVSYCERIKDHATKDDAIRAAICKAAIAYLTAERESKVPA